MGVGVWEGGFLPNSVCLCPFLVPDTCGSLKVHSGNGRCRGEACAMRSRWRRAVAKRATKVPGTQASARRAWQNNRGGDGASRTWAWTCPFSTTDSAEPKSFLAESLSETPGVQAQMPGHPGHSRSKTNRKRRLAQSFCPGRPRGISRCLGP